MIKCPYCSEERPSRSRLQTHVNQIHYFEDTQPNRMAAVDASVTRANQCESTISSGFGQTYHCPQTKGHQDDHGDPKGSPRWKNDTGPGPRCTCGATVELIDGGDGTRLMHSFRGNGGCTDARLQSHEPTPQDRMDLQAEWARVGAGLDKAGEEMREMRAALDAVDERMRKLDAELTKPSVVRRATLNQVWDRLLDAGHLAAAREVMRMIERVVD